MTGSLVICVLGALLGTTSAALFLYHDARLYEGSTCDLISGGKGVCQTQQNCTSYLQGQREIKVCGYKKSEELICCPNINYTGPYPALAQACGDRYRQVVERIELVRDTHRRRSEEMERQRMHEHEYQSLPGKLKDVIKDKCNKESAIIDDETERKSFLQKCFLIQPGTPSLSPSAIFRSYLTQHPHMAALGWSNSDGTTSWNCGGSLIHRSFVLTAAHCTKNIGKPPDIVRVGDVDLAESFDDTIAVNYYVERVFVHEDYKPPAYYNDIALLKLRKTEEFKNKIRPLPACIWPDEELPSNKLLMMGYGAPGFTQDFLGKLYEGNLTVMEQETCKALYNDKNTEELPSGVVESQICAHDPEGILDTCEGDSGGPLQINIDDGAKTPYIAGITSFGILCLDGNPGVYTKLYPFLGWINEVITQNYP